jgi:ACR3 family arsenite efflux pump ArsB
MGVEGWYAATVLAVWLIGIIWCAVALVAYGPRDPQFQSALDTDPVGFLLVMALFTVMWPVILAAAHCHRWLQARPRRR